MNNYCRNCGEKLTNQDVCDKCGTKVLTVRLGEVDKALEKKYIWIFVIILVISAIVRLIIPAIAFTVLPLVTMIFLIYAKKKLKYSTFFNIVFWVFLTLLILFILLIVLLLISCEYTF